MITNFKGFGPVHLLTLFAGIIIGLIFIIWGIKTKADDKRQWIRLILAAAIIIVRGVRYIMDAQYGVFDWYDLFSLHICHVDMILLVICLIKPNKALFSFCFLIGIPTALSVALFPGSNHPAPGVPRAIFFIMSHVMLIIGALYLSIAEHMKPTLKMYGFIAVVVNIGFIPVYFVNRWLGTNYLYIMEAPKGSVIVLFEKVFGWPGYVIALDIMVLIMMFIMLGLGRLIFRLTATVRKKQPEALTP
jgi:hypothetical integral membrane protein (TIGR02206 family)